jgi:hypothetical protein
VGEVDLGGGWRERGGRDSESETNNNDREGEGDK